MVRHWISIPIFALLALGMQKSCQHYSNVSLTASLTMTPVRFARLKKSCIIFQYGSEIPAEPRLSRVAAKVRERPFEEEELQYRGFCSTCGCSHAISSSPEAREACVRILKNIEVEGCVDFDVSKSERDQNLGTDSLLDNIGKMFGVLLCVDPKSGEKVFLKAFSGNIGGRWHVEGWVDPVLTLNYQSQHYQEEMKRIQRLGAQIREWKEESGEEILDGRIAVAREEQRQLSRNLTKAMWQSATVTNFRKEQSSLQRVWDEAAAREGGMKKPLSRMPPSGFGDCCAPKLLNAASKLSLCPVSLAEAWWGKPPPGGGRVPYQFYPSCKEKCSRLLGFSLCGAVSSHGRRLA